MIATLLKHYRVESVKVKLKSMKDHANFDVDHGTLQLSTRYRTLKSSQIKQFLITIIHEIDHAMMARKYGWKRFKGMWEYEANLITQGHYKNKSEPYDHNKYEIQAEKFGQKHWKQWYKTFKKDELF